jgi:hypothetical protein
MDPVVLHRRLAGGLYLLLSFGCIAIRQPDTDGFG